MLFFLEDVIKILCKNLTWFCLCASVLNNLKNFGWSKSWSIIYILFYLELQSSWKLNLFKCDWCNHFCEILSQFDMPCPMLDVPRRILDWPPPYCVIFLLFISVIYTFIFLFFSSYLCSIQSYLLYFLNLWFLTFSNVFWDIYFVCNVVGHNISINQYTHPAVVA